MHQTNNSRLQLHSMLKRLTKSRTFVRNFSFLMGILTLFLLLFSLTIFNQSKNILLKNFTENSRYQLEKTAETIDNHLMNTLYVANALDINHMVQCFFAYEHPETLYQSFYFQIQETLKSFLNGFSYIDSIYLYSECSNTILTAYDRITLSYFSDTNWMEQISKENDGFSYFFRAKNSSYPYLLCVVKKLTVNGYSSAIVINLNLGKISQLTDFGNDPLQEFYLISEDNRILYRNLQAELSEPISLIPELVHFKADSKQYTILTNTGDSPYTYAQLHSTGHPWHYVLITRLDSYTAQLSSSRLLFLGLFAALFIILLLISFLYAMRTSRPIQALLRMISDPQQAIGADLYNDAEIGYIAAKVTGYIQQNQALTDELSERLNLLNHARLVALQAQINPHFIFNTLDMIHIKECEALGYFHEVPKLTLSLSRLLHYGITSTDLVSLETELSFTKIYINLLKECYNQQLQIEYDLDSTALQANVPKLFIQPFVENAIFHGFSKNIDRPCLLTLSCHRTEHLYIVSVKDNGIGMTAEKLTELKQKLKEEGIPKDNIGIQNTVTRMQLLYGDMFQLEMESTPGQGTLFTLKFHT